MKYLLALAVLFTNALVHADSGGNSSQPNYHCVFFDVKNNVASLDVTAENQKLAEIIASVRALDFIQGALVPKQENKPTAVFIHIISDVICSSLRLN
jgi:hypothetical protein